MAGKSKNGGSGLLLLAGLGVGAFLLFNKAGGPPSGDNATSMPETGEDIPAVPKFVAVNTAATESPLPTGIVSDEDGMMPAAPGSQLPTTATKSSSWQDEPDDDATPAPSSTIPAVISTKLTEKEKAVIQKGVLSDELAVKRPDLYKAIYVRKHGQKGKGQQALKAADSIIQQIKVKTTATSKPVPAKKRKVAVKLNTKIAPKRAAVRKAVTPPSSSKPATKPLVLVKRPAPKAKHPASKPHPVKSKVVAKRTVRKHAPTQPSARPRH